MTTKNTPIEDTLTFKIFKDFVTFEDDCVLLSDFTPKELAILFYIIMPDDVKIAYQPSYITCECGCKMHRHQYTNWTMNDTYSIYKLRYKCPKCNKTKGPDLDGIAEKGRTYTNDIKRIPLDISAVEHVSYEKISDFINDSNGTNISRQQVYNYKIIECEEYLNLKEEKIEEKLNELEIKPTGFMGYDEAFFRLNRIKCAYLSMVDPNNRLIINDNYIPEEHLSYFIENFITFSLKDLSVYADSNTPNPQNYHFLPYLKKDTLIGDGHRAYPNIAKKNNMDFHPCGFHIIKNQREPTWKHQRNIKRKVKSNNNKKIKNNEKINRYAVKYRGRKGRIPLNDKKRRKEKDKATKLSHENTCITNENSKLIKEYNELEDLSERISAILDADSIDEAKRRFNILNNQKEHLSDEFVRALNTIGNDLDATLSHIENENIPKTNNWLELFFRVIFPKRFRNRFKTVLGVDNFLRLAKIRWNERVVLGEKVEIERGDIWEKLRKKYATP